jgi:quercetin dioxygenase-like cupin family protein
MALPHATSGQIIDIRPLGDKLKQSLTTTLVKTDKLEIIRLVLPAGKEVPQHQVAGEITVQCLEGMVGFSVQGQTKVLQAGQLLYLSGTELHGLRGIEDSSVLVTILLEKKVG